MTYSLIIEHDQHHGYPTRIHDIETWGEVLDHIRHKLDQWAIKVRIYKWSSNNKCLGEKCVTMGNLYEIANAPNDKILL